MSLFKYFKRNGTEVQIDVDSNLQVPKFLYPFSFDCSDENYAELLTIRLNERLEEYKREIARKAIHYLSCSEISALKSELTSWNGKKHCWKR